MASSESLWHVWLFATVMCALAMGVGFLTVDPHACYFPEAGWGLPGSGMVCFDYWLNRYQTLIGGTFALTAAWIGFVAISRQTTQAADLEELRRQRQALAAIAVMPLALDRLAYYVQQCVDALKKFGSDSLAVEDGWEPEKPLSFQAPRFPDEIIGPLKEAVEFLKDQDAAEVRRIISELQIFRARIGGTKRWGPEAQDRLVDAAILHAYTSRLFSFSRSDLQSRPLRTSLIDSSLSALSLEPLDEDFSHLQKVMAVIREREFLEDDRRPRHEWN